MDKDYPYVTDLITLATEMIDKADKINHRLISCIIVLTVSFCLCFTITIVSVTYCYFTTDYNYPQVNQTENSNSKIEINKGVTNK